MSLFGGFFGDDDPFFGGHMRQMNRMMDPFDMFGGFPGMGGAPGARGSGSLMPFGFPNMNAIMDNFMGMGNMNMSSSMNMGSPNMHSFSQSTVMTMSSGPDGQPRIYQESHSTRTAPGGIKETKKAVSDSRSGTKRMAIGRHIYDRGHVQERVQNLQSGELEETEDYINLEEEEAEEFNREWRQKSRDLPSQRQAALAYREGRDRDRQRAMPAIMPAASSSPRIEEVDDDDEEVNVIAERPRKRPREPAHSVTIEEIPLSPPLPRPTKKSSKSSRHPKQ